MTANRSLFDHTFLGRVANRINNECSGVNRMNYDRTSKSSGEG